MKFLVVGLGSMGRRRVRNLQYLKVEEVIGFDIREDRCKKAEDKYGIKTFKKFEEAMEQNPAALVISVPSNQHHKYALLAAEANKHFFTESNFLPEGIENLIEIEKRKDIVAVPSFTMPHHSSVKLIKKIISENKVEKVLCFTYHLSAYLPDWHPWEDYRQVYYSKKETAGCKEMIAFELTWLTWLLGDVKKVSCFKGKLSDLETNIDDVYQIILKFRNGILGNMLIEVVSRPSLRELKLISKEGTILWDSEEGLVKVFDVQKKEWKEYSEEIGIVEPDYSVRTHEEMYIEEMEDFLKALKKEKVYPYSFKKEKKIIDLVAAIEKSAKESISVNIKERL